MNTKTRRTFKTLSQQAADAGYTLEREGKYVCIGTADGDYLCNLEADRDPLLWTLAETEEFLLATAQFRT